MNPHPLVYACLIALSSAFAATPAHAVKPADTAALPAPNAALSAAVAGAWRDPANTVRDQYRHPAQTLAFFGLTPTQTVVEITPGGGWYAEILAPYLHDGGKYVAAVVDPDAVAKARPRDYHQRNKTELETKFRTAPAHYGKAIIIGFDPSAPIFGPPNSADAVVSFRNVHNWRSGSHAEGWHPASQAEGMFKGFFAVLKPGGVLGVVEHRAKADVPDGDRSGYISEAQVIALAEAAGFKLSGRSDINANPRDTTVHPNGVWTLPPVNAHDAADQEKYAAIGESDRMTLKFVKP